MELLTPYSLSRGAPSASRASLRALRPRTRAAPKDTGSTRLRQTFQIVALLGFGAAIALFAVDALVNLLAMHGNILGRSDADAHLVALDPEHGHGDRISDHQRFAYAAGQDEH